MGVGDGHPAEERRSRVLAEVSAGRGDVSELSATLGVSVATVRRDLSRLAEEGRLARTYGGAVIVAHPVERRLAEKELSNREAKEAIAATAAELVSDGDLLIIDAGTTTAELSRKLRDREALTVVTNGVNNIAILSDAPHVEVICLGGTLRRISQAFVGTVTEAALRHVVADKVFLGGEGVLNESGISCPTLEQSTLKALMASQAQQVYLLADHTKLGLRPFPFFAPMPARWTLITDDAATIDQLGPFEADPNVSIRIAPRVPAAGRS